MEFQNSKIAWSWLYDHPKLVYTDMRPNPLSDDNTSTYKHEAHSLDEGLKIRPAWVNPETNEIDDNESLNTKFQTWLEVCLPASNMEILSFLSMDGSTEEIAKNAHKYNLFDQYRFHLHDYELDCGGDTFEEAIINLATLVLEKYGDYIPDCEEIPFPLL